MGNIPPSVHRLPPPPLSRHRHNGGSPTVGVSDTHSIEKEQISEMAMAGSNCVSSNLRTRAFYPRRCKKIRSLTNIDSLPEEVVFNILGRLTAQDIYNTARLVCSKWYHMIHTHSFINAHLHRSTTRLLIQSQVAFQSPLFVSVSQEGRIEISKFSNKLRDIVWTSCNGLVLECEEKNWSAIYIANPATKQHFVLPPLSRGTTYFSDCGLAYVEASMEYKVVCTYPCIRANMLCAILTVGVDTSWRHVQTDHLCVTPPPQKRCLYTEDPRELLYDTPLVTKGFLHWVGYRIEFLLSLNLETEIITQIPIPHGYGVRTLYYLSGGSCLSFLAWCGELLWEVWEMKPDNGEWIKLPNFDMEAQRCRLEELFGNTFRWFRPVGWAKYKEAMVFCVSKSSRHYIAYNVVTREMASFETLDPKPFNYVQHTNSLVWLGG